MHEIVTTADDAGDITREPDDCPGTVDRSRLQSGLAIMPAGSNRNTTNPTVTIDAQKLMR